MARGRTKVRSRRQRGDANAEDAQNGKKQKPVLPNGQQGEKEPLLPNGQQGEKEPVLPSGQQGEKEPVLPNGQ